MALEVVVKDVMTFKGDDDKVHRQVFINGDNLSEVSQRILLYEMRTIVKALEGLC